MKVYIRSVYRAHRFTKLKVEEKNGRLTCTFSFQFTDIKESDAPIRRGSLTAIPSVNELKSQLPSILDDLSQSIGEAPAVTEAGPLNMLHTAIHLRKPNRTNSESERSLSYSQFLRKSPLPTFIFPECLSYKEDPLRGNMRPTFHHLFINRWSVAKNRHILGSPKFPYWGNGDQFCLIDENGVSEMCFLNPYRASTAVETKRAIARHVGSICAYQDALTSVNQFVRKVYVRRTTT